MDVHQGIKRTDRKSSELANVNQTDDNVIMPIDVVNTTVTNIQQLNEYCLLDIFSSNSLTLVDLCSLAETCRLFKGIIQRVFPKEFGIETGCNIGLGYYFKWNTYRNFFTRLQDVDRILKNFGSRLVTLSLRRHIDVVNLVVKYCGDAAIKRLKIEHFKTNECIRLNFQRLQELSIVGGDLHCLSDFKCDSLTKLEIVSSTYSTKILQCTFPNLQRFTMLNGGLFAGNVWCESRSHQLAEFIVRHKRLQTLNTCAKTVKNCVELLKVIGNNCKEVEELSLKGLWSHETSFEISSLRNLTKLRRLHVNFRWEMYMYDYYKIHVALIQALECAETLELSNLAEVPAHVFNVLPRLQNLRELRLIGFWFNRIPWTMLTQLRKVYLSKPITAISAISVDDLFDIIRHLTNVEELILAVGMFNQDKLFELTEEDFSKIVKMVEQRPKVLTLTCKFNFDYSENCYENGKVRLIKAVPEQ